MPYLTISAANLFAPDPDQQLWYRRFAGGVMVLTSNIATQAPTEFHFDTDPAGKHITTQFFLAGEATIRMGNGGIGHWSENGMSVIRSDSTGFRLRVEAGQRLRHVCVSMYQHDLHKHLAQMASPQIKRLMATAGPVDLAVPVPSGPGMRQLAEKIFDHNTAEGLGGLKTEGLAMEFMAEVLERFSVRANATDDNGSTMPWQRTAIEKLKAAIDKEPLRIHSEAELLNHFGMGEAMTRRIFRDEVGVTLSAYMRRARLEWARLALHDYGTIKNIAFACGYTHIGNFTRAYRQAFGEAPRETRQHKRAG